LCFLSFPSQAKVEKHCIVEGFAVEGGRGKLVIEDAKKIIVQEK
jgi:hypothetical protein